MASIKQKSTSTSRRHLRRILAMLALIVVLVVTTNNIVFRMIRSPENIATAQLIEGWGRIYKPMIFDAAAPEMVSFGHSWVRDIFDPVPIRELTGKTFFNFGVSGASSFESLRLAQNMLAVHTPEHAFLDIYAFADAPRARLVKHQFDERILSVNRDGTRNPTVGISRWIKLNTAGAALAFNYRFLGIQYALATGASREDLLRPYERRQWDMLSDEIEDYRQRLESATPPTPVAPASIARQPTYEDLQTTVTMLCSAGTNVHIYDGPRPCSRDVNRIMETRALLGELAQSCTASITYHSFGYPNAVTMEGLSEGAGDSLFFRPDGHPRPTIGQMVLTRILKLPSDKNVPPLPGDFGVDLLALDQQAASEWVQERHARCFGSWIGDSYRETLDEMEALLPEWRRLYD